MDYAAIQRDDDWRPIAETGIARSDIFVLLESGDALQSEAVQYELQYRRMAYRKSGREWRGRQVEARVPATGDIEVDREIRKRADAIWTLRAFSALKKGVPLADASPGFPSVTIKSTPYFQRDTGSIAIPIPNSLHPESKYEAPASVASKSIGNIQGWLSVNLPALETFTKQLGLPCPPRDLLDRYMREYLKWAAAVGHKPLHDIEKEVLNEHLLQRAQTGDSDGARRLLDLGADVEAGADRGVTALVLSAADGHTQTVQILLRAGANTKARGGQWRTALIQAARAGHLETVDELIAHSNDDLNLTDKAGMTALMWATKNGHLPVVRALVEAGADVNVRDTNGQTALDRAPRRKRSAIQHILEFSGTGK